VQDYVRHTAVSSMYLAKHKHEGEAATWAGNSPNVVHRYYKDLTLRIALRNVHAHVEHE
jgi:hypothetical protein